MFVCVLRVLRVLNKGQYLQRQGVKGYTCHVYYTCIMVYYYVLFKPTKSKQDD